MVQHDDHTGARLSQRQAKWAEADQRELDEAITAMLQHKQTRRYLYWLFEITGAIGQNPYRNNFGDTAFACGEQNVGQRVLAHLLECAPDGFVSLLKERADERAERNGKLDEIRSGVEPE